MWGGNALFMASTSYMCCGNVAPVRRYSLCQSVTLATSPHRAKAMMIEPMARWCQVVWSTQAPPTLEWTRTRDANVVLSGWKPFATMSCNHLSADAPSRTVAQSWSMHSYVILFAARPASFNFCSHSVTLTVSPLVAKRFSMMLKQIKVGTRPLAVILLSQTSALTTSPTFAQAWIMQVRVPLSTAKPWACISDSQCSARLTAPHFELPCISKA
mmetsp:Transcript_2112/g.6417  ORF Transcript_2112/g.6417 Transcript_2112/m.6417 type:complete len:214 (-) Transcript_2112:812-1453(-)